MEIKTAYTKVTALLDRYFFSKAYLMNLGLIRIFVCAVSLRYNINPLKHVFTDQNLVALHVQPFLIKFLSYPFSLIEHQPDLFKGLFFLSAFCSIVGFLTRPALFVFGAMTIYTTGLEATHGIFSHEYSLISQVILMLAFVPGVKWFSVDRLLAWLREKEKDKSLLESLKGQAFPVWGFRLILIVVACTYFTAGLSKIRYGSLKWLDGKTLSFYLDGSASPFTPKAKPMYIGPKEAPQHEKWKDGFGLYNYSYGNRAGHPLALKAAKAIASSGFIMKGLSVATVILEMAGFLLLFGRWPRTIFLISVFIMHVTIGFLMHLPFVEYRVLLLCLFDWQWIWATLSEKLNFLKAVPGYKVSTSNR